VKNTDPVSNTNNSGSGTTDDTTTPNATTGGSTAPSAPAAVPSTGAMRPVPGGVAPAGGNNASAANIPAAPAPTQRALDTLPATASGVVVIDRGPALDLRFEQQQPIAAALTELLLGGPANPNGNNGMNAGDAGRGHGGDLSLDPFVTQSTGKAPGDNDRSVTAVEAVNVTGVAVSVGAVWWAARSTGLWASLVVVMPAWRHVDLLAILPDDLDHGGWNLHNAEAARDEIAAGSLFDAPEERAHS
jgi:hypothetical protein